MSDQSLGAARFVRAAASGQSRWRNEAAERSLPHPSRRANARAGCMSSAPEKIELGQNWAVWLSGRRQWLLAKVIWSDRKKAELHLDDGYGIAVGESRIYADNATMLCVSTLFRYIDG